VAQREQRLQSGNAATGDRTRSRGLDVPAIHVLSDWRFGEDEA
jgi:hypothetical protein